MTAFSDETGREPSREAVAAMLARMLYNDATLDESTSEQRAHWLAAADAIRRMYRRAAPVAQEPVAYVPIHPRNGPLWMDTFPANADVSESRSATYERRALYTSPPATPAALGADEIARIIEPEAYRLDTLIDDPNIQDIRKEWAREKANAILALLSRAGDQK